jgi:hypothetical protein
MKDFSFQGKVHIGLRQANGKPGALRWVDDASQFSIALQTETSERQESWSGNRLTSVRIPKAKKATFTLVINAANAQNMALALQGTATAVAGSTVTGEVLPLGLVAGDLVALDYPRISALTLSDSTPVTPLVPTLNTHYTIDSADGGIIKIVNPAGFVQPLKAAYTYGAHVNLSAFTIASIERYLILDGINTVDNERIRLRAYRCAFDPVSDLGLITDDLGNISLSGSILFDSVNYANANLGGFCSVQLPSEV